MEQLKKCPFCGGEAEVFKASELGDSSLSSDRFTVKCRSCFCGVGLYSDSARAIERWNTRKPMERIVERLEELADSHNFSSDKKDIAKYIAYKRAIEIVKEEI